MVILPKNSVETPCSIQSFSADGVRAVGRVEIGASGTRGHQVHRDPAAAGPALPARTATARQPRASIRSATTGDQGDLAVKGAVHGTDAGRPAGGSMTVIGPRVSLTKDSLK
jgi:hypothetical protein